MAITNVHQITGFDAQQYNLLLEAAKSEYVSQAQVDKALLDAVNAGKTFDQAISMVTTSLPTLPPPMGTGTVWDNGLLGLPSFSANYLAMIGDVAAQQRRQSAEQRAMQTEITVNEIKDQAKEMRAKAITQLCIGIVTGTLSIAQGAMSFKMMKSGLDKKPGRQASMLLNTRVQSFTSAAGGVTGMMSSINQAAGGFFDANIKARDANIERSRAMSDSLKSLEDALRELVQKMLSTMDAIQQSTNQTRTKILG